MNTSTCHGCQGRGWVGPWTHDPEILKVLKDIASKLGAIYDKYIRNVSP